MTDYSARYNDKKWEFQAESSWDAEKKARAHFKVPKSKWGYLSVHPKSFYEKGDFRFLSKGGDIVDLHIMEKGGKVDVFVAQEILKQLGGAGRLKMFTGANQFVAYPSGVSFRIKNRSINYVKITLNAMDTYDVYFAKVSGAKMINEKEFNNIYNDQLVSLFEENTGMYLSLKYGGDTNQSEYFYIGNCVNYEDLEDLDSIVDNSEEVSFSELKNAVNKESLNNLIDALGYNKTSFTIDKDWSVKFYKSKHEDGTPVYYIQHSAIEYIFSPKGCAFEKGGAMDDLGNPTDPKVLEEMEAFIEKEMPKLDKKRFFTDGMKRKEAKRKFYEKHKYGAYNPRFSIFAKGGKTKSKPLTFEEFKKELPDVSSPFFGERGVTYKAKYDRHTSSTKYFKHGRSNGTKIPVKTAYEDAYLQDLKSGSTYAKGGKIKDYEYIHADNITELSAIVKGQSKTIKGSDILSGAYIRDKSKAVPQVEKIKRKILSCWKDSGRFNEIKKFVKEIDINYFLNYIPEQIIIAFYCGVSEAYQFSGDVYGDGLDSLKTDFITKYIKDAKSIVRRKDFEIGIKYPNNIDWKFLGKPLEIKEIKGKINTLKLSTGNKTTQHIYKIWTFKKGVYGKIIARIENGKYDDTYFEGSKAKMDGSYASFVSSNIGNINYFLQQLTKQSKIFIKDMDVLVNKLGGVSASELKKNKIKFAKGGKLESARKKVDAMTNKEVLNEAETILWYDMMDEWDEKDGMELTVQQARKYLIEHYSETDEDDNHEAFAKGGEITFDSDYYGYSARVPYLGKTFLVEMSKNWNAPFKDVVVSDNSFRVIDDTTAKKVYHKMLKAKPNSPPKFAKGGRTHNYKDGKELANRIANRVTTLKINKNFEDGGFVEYAIWYKSGGETDRKIKIVNKGVKFNKKKYQSIFGDFDKDGVVNIDDANPLKKDKKGKVEEVELSKTFEALLDVKNELDDTMKETVNLLDKKTPKSADIYARTKSPYSILKKLVEKRMLDPKKGLTDMIGTTIAVGNQKELEQVRDKIDKGMLGKVIEKEDFYKSPKAGYMAYHYIVDYKGIPVEVQLKTKSMKQLHEISHEFYKKGNLDVVKLKKTSELFKKADTGDKDALKEVKRLLSDKNALAKQLEKSVEKNSKTPVVGKKQPSKKLDKGGVLDKLKELGITDYDPNAHHLTVINKIAKVIRQSNETYRDSLSRAMKIYNKIMK